MQYQQEIGAMMFVSGDVRHPQHETTQLVEAIVRQQAQETLHEAMQVALRRGSRSVQAEDVLFLVRHDRLKLGRLSAYLGWRKVRRIANRAGASSPADVPDDIDVDVQPNERVRAPQRRVRLPWALLDAFRHYDDLADSDDNDEDDRIVHADARKRLRNADLITRSMTHVEYLDYAECRQASFTYKKPSRFKDWIGPCDGFTRPSNDLIDILGFLCFENVRSLTRLALVVKSQMDFASADNTTTMDNTTSPYVPSAATTTFVSPDEHPVLLKIEQDLAVRHSQLSIFSNADRVRPLLPIHIHEAYRRLRNGDGHVKKTTVKAAMGAFQ